MLKINFDAWKLDVSCIHSVFITAYGNTPEEIHDDARRQAQEQGCFIDGSEFGGNEANNNYSAYGLTAVGLHNKRDDWEAIYGPVARGGCGDDWE